MVDEPAADEVGVVEALGDAGGAAGRNVRDHAAAYRSRSRQTAVVKTREELLAEFFPPPRQEPTFQIEVEVTGGRVVDGELEELRIELTTGELAELPDDWQVMGTVETAWRVADGLGYPLRIADESRLRKNLSEAELA